MSDKIRIVGAFGDGAVEKVQEFVKGLEGVESVSVLKDGIETYPEADSVKEADAAAAAEAEQAGLPPDAATAPPESAS
jgi:hypothetical protein